MHPSSWMPFEKQSRLRPVDIELIPCFGHPPAKDPLLPFFNAENRLRFYCWCHVTRRVPASLSPSIHDSMNMKSNSVCSLLPFHPIPLPWKKGFSYTFGRLISGLLFFFFSGYLEGRKGAGEACHRIVCRYYGQSFITPSKSLFYGELPNCSFSHAVEKSEYKYLGFGIRNGC